ncbi:hypothetical protein Pcar_3227 [Syntrophotalea carbinolica DSM 2380]|uniref:Uncharacterized protein n=1 Tax=Syntrophotalea carbinolica (strain DSM 2380 / NBRC 103641 / GraBd1) TaxID=338963 RepID=Q0C6U0_SYNC1|nr:hypothetical protein Pcar_3227 [Syntrophotalea carbinolica DSM 2380]
MIGLGVRDIVTVDRHYRKTGASLLPNIGESCGRKAVIMAKAYEYNGL